MVEMPVFSSSRRGEVTSPLLDFVIPSVYAAELPRESSSGGRGEVTSPLRDRNSFSYMRWGKNIGSGFLQEGIDSVRALFSVQGLLFGGATFLVGSIPMFSRYFKKFLRWGMYGGLIWGGARLFTGAILTFTREGSEAELAGRQVGRGLFYFLPLGGALMGKVEDCYVSRLVGKKLSQWESKAGGTVLSEEALEPLACQMDDFIERIVRGLPDEVSTKIRDAYQNPIAQEVYGLSEAESFFPNILTVSSKYAELESPALRRFFDIILSIDKLHEARHLRQNYEVYPRLWTHCVKREMDGFPSLMGLLRDREGRNWGVLSEAVRWWFLNRLRSGEKEALAVEYEAVHEVLSGVDWRKTFFKLVGQDGVRISPERLTGLVSDVNHNLVFPFALPRDMFIWQRIQGVKDAYPRLRFFNASHDFVTETYFLRSAYLYLVGSDITGTAVSFRKKVKERTINIDIDVHFH